jgi:hypothetical protein
VIVELAQDDARSGLEAGCGQQKEETEQQATAHCRPSRTGYIREHGRRIAEGSPNVESFSWKNSLAIYLNSSIFGAVSWITRPPRHGESSVESSSVMIRNPAVGNSLEIGHG